MYDVLNHSVCDNLSQQQQIVNTHEELIESAERVAVRLERQVRRTLYPLLCGAHFILMVMGSLDGFR